ncbi:MAG: Fic family protein [Bacteroidales bacterium]|nr:Fic family protein [Bacteroidales bacterium]
MDGNQYINQTEPEKSKRYTNWQAAKGLQDVDGLKTSDYLDKVALENIEGKISAYEAKDLIDTYYDVKEDREKDSLQEEADKVASRINILIGEIGFSLSTEELKSIHKRLFEGVFEHAGNFRKNNIIKHEWVLDGDTVTYGNAYNLEDSVESMLRAERLTPFRSLDEEETVWHIAKFISELWRLHPFAEGNTRTTAVFAIKYLRMLGFDVDNSVFESHSRFFRDALVRANYANIKKGVYEDRGPLDNFFSDLMLGTRHEFHSRYLHIYADNARLETKDIDTRIMEMVKTNRHITRQEIANALGVSVKTIERHIKKLPLHFRGPAKTGEWKTES